MFYGIYTFAKYAELVLMRCKISLLEYLGVELIMIMHCYLAVNITEICTFMLF